MTGPTNQDGRDINVISKQIPVQIGSGSLVFEIALWTVIPVIGALALLTEALPRTYSLGLLVLGALPGLIFQFMKTYALAYLRKLQQKIQADASQIDNYLAQRVVVLNNVAGLAGKAIDLDKDVMKSVAAYRSGHNADAERNQASQTILGRVCWCPEQRRRVGQSNDCARRGGKPRLYAKRDRRSAAGISTAWHRCRQGCLAPVDCFGGAVWLKRLLSLILLVPGTGTGIDYGRLCPARM